MFMQTLDQKLGMQIEHGQYLRATVPILLKLFISCIFNKQAMYMTNMYINWKSNYFVYYANYMYICNIVMT